LQKTTPKIVQQRDIRFVMTSKLLFILFVVLFYKHYECGSLYIAKDYLYKIDLKAKNYTPMFPLPANLYDQFVCLRKLIAVNDSFAIGFINSLQGSYIVNIYIKEKRTLSMRLFNNTLDNIFYNPSDRKLFGLVLHILDKNYTIYEISKASLIPYHYYGFELKESPQLCSYTPFINVGYDTVSKVVYTVVLRNAILDSVDMATGATGTIPFFNYCNEFKFDPITKYFYGVTGQSNYYYLFRVSQDGIFEQFSDFETDGDPYFNFVTFALDGENDIAYIGLNNRFTDIMAIYTVQLSTGILLQKVNMPKSIITSSPFPVLLFV